MKLISRGKTKDLYQLSNGNYLFKFRDDVTGKDGVFDPGANAIGLSLPGAGKAALRLSKHFFQLLKSQQITTHYLEADTDALTMTVLPAIPLAGGLEVICRYRAVGSYFRRYGKFVEEGAPLKALIEFTLKDDERQDPPITEDSLKELGLMSGEEATVVKELARRVSAIVKNELATKGIELYDIKLEFGWLPEGIALIDEISGGNMRAFKGGIPVGPLALEKLILGDSSR